MAEKQQDLGEKPVDLMQETVKVPDGLHLTISYAKVVDLNNPKDVGEWIMVQMMATGKPVNVVVDHITREVKPSPGAGLSAEAESEGGSLTRGVSPESAV